MKSRRGVLTILGTTILGGCTGQENNDETTNQATSILESDTPTSAPTPETTSTRTTTTERRTSTTTETNTDPNTTTTEPTTTDQTTSEPSSTTTTEERPAFEEWTAKEYLDNQRELTPQEIDQLYLDEIGLQLSNNQIKNLDQKGQNRSIETIDDIIRAAEEAVSGSDNFRMASRYLAIKHSDYDRGELNIFRVPARDSGGYVRLPTFMQPDEIRIGSTIAGTGNAERMVRSPESEYFDPDEKNRTAYLDYSETQNKDEETLNDMFGGTIANLAEKQIADIYNEHQFDHPVSEEMRWSMERMFEDETNMETFMDLQAAYVDLIMTTDWDETEGVQVSGNLNSLEDTKLRKAYDERYV